MSGAIPPLPLTLSCRGARLKQRDNFTLLPLCELSVPPISNSLTYCVNNANYKALYVITFHFASSLIRPHFRVSCLLLTL
jgi:hypothetical protein